MWDASRRKAPPAATVCANLPGILGDFFFRYFAHGGGGPRAPMRLILRRDAGGAYFRHVFAFGERLI
jgi:hypothetical protein